MTADPGGATYMHTRVFEEPGAPEEVARLAADWFRAYLGGDDDSR
jgi:hypothetical protein